MCEKWYYTFFELLQREEGRQPCLLDQYSDLGQLAFIPKELASYPPTHFLKLRDHDE